MGTAQVQQSLLWLDGFVATQQSSGKGGSGGGGGKGGGGKNGGAYYLYTADCVTGLCIGPILGIGDVWTGQSWLGNPNAAESYTISGSGIYTPTNASSLVNDLGASFVTTYSGTYSDFGAPSSTVLSGNDSTPLLRMIFGTTLASGQYSIDPATNNYHFNTSSDAGKQVQIPYSFLLTNINQQENDIIPGSGTIAVGGTFQFSTDLGVVYTNTQVKLTRVSGTPTAAGQYQVTGSAPATYHFYVGAGGDLGAEVTITYSIVDAAAVGQGQSTQLNFTLNTGQPGQSPYSFLTSTFPAAALGYTSVATLLYQPMGLGASAEVQQNRFEVITPDVYGGGIEDCNPVQCIYQVLTNSVTGLGAGAIPFPTAAIDNGSGGTWGGASSTPGARTSGSTAWNWFAANSFFISPVLDAQDSAASTVSKWLEAGMCASYFSEGLLKLVPYGDTTTAGNGVTWTAPSAYVVALDDTCFVPGKSEGDDPVKIERAPYADAMNVVQVQWDNRSAQYSPEITQESDQAAVNMWGERREDPQNWDFIHTLTAATFAANMRVKHNVYIRNKYTFTLPYTYSYLEPMDIVTISTTSAWAIGLNNANLGIVNLPVRITKIVDDPKAGIEITAEDYPFGAHQPTLYNKGISTADVVANAFADPGNSEVVMFEATARMTGYSGNEIWIGANGASENYGYTNVWVSQDGTKYEQIGTIKSPARLGVLTSTFNSGSDPDTTNSLVVTMAENSGSLTAGSTTDADNSNTDCFVDGEIIAYSAASVTGQNTYTMNGYIRRGLHNTPISSHAAGTLFMRLDGAIFKYQYDPNWAGQTLWFKFQAVNAFGNNPQQLSSLTPVSFTVPGKNPGTIEAGSGLVITPSNVMVGAGPLGWNPIATTSDTSINYTNYAGYAGWSASNTPSGVQVSNIYARWTGYLIPSVTGIYTLGVNSDDGASLYIAGHPIVNNLTAAQAGGANLTYTQSSTLALTKGVPYPVVLEWQNNVGGGGLQLLWTPPGASTALIPTGNLSTSHSSVTGTLSGTWWNGTTGLWYPTGNAFIDPANKTLYGPPNSGGGSNVVSSVLTSTANMYTAPGAAAGLPYNVPGWIVGQVWSAGQQVCIIVPSGNTNQGYFFNIGMNNGSEQCYISRYSSASSGTIGATQTAATGLTYYTPTNPGTITGWWNFAIYIGAAGYMACWINGNLAADCTDTTYNPVNTATGICYVGLQNGWPGPFKIAPAPIGTSAGSSFINQQSSIVTFSDYTLSYSSTTTTLTWSWGAFDIYFPDGSTISVAASSGSVTTHSNSGVATSVSNRPIEFTGLSASTTYYYSPFVIINGNSATVAILATGTSAPTLAQQVQTVNGDGNCALNSSVYVTAATPSSGTGGGSGGGGGTHGCFTGNVGVQTPEGLVLFERLPRSDIFYIKNETGTFPAKLIVHDNFHETMLDMGDGKLVTMGHVIKNAEGNDVPAIDVFTNAPHVEFTGTVYNLAVLGEDHHYILDNGIVAHNMKVI